MPLARISDQPNRVPLFYLFWHKKAHFSADDRSHWDIARLGIDSTSAEGSKPPRRARQRLYERGLSSRRHVRQIPIDLVRSAQAVPHQEGLIHQKSEIIRL